MAKEKIEALRGAMKKYGMDYYIIPSGDAHGSEYVADHWRGRAWASSFTGSAGTLLVGLNRAILWTDGRYFIQAENQLKDTGIELFKMRMPKVPTLNEWLKANVRENEVVSFDGKVISTNSYNDIDKIVKENKANLKSDRDLLEEVWIERPEIPNSEIFNHDVKYSGKSTEKKLRDVRREMKNKGVTHYIISSLDDIAWIYNIRANDVPNNPVVISYALISEEEACLFTNLSRVPEGVKIELQNNGVVIKSYEDIEGALKEIKVPHKIYMDGDKTSSYLNLLIDGNVERSFGLNITTKLKAIKNSVEIENLYKSQTRDGVAMVKFIKWLKESVGKEKITEISASQKLEEFRAKGENFKGISFDTIAGYKEHAAMMHYFPTEEIQYELEPKGFFLVDSGAQYLDGTTDITRTIVLGELTEEEKKDFTLVLKGHINLAKARFLHGTTGSNLDVLARTPLWNEGIDYKCGTGHGVGFFLSVHEGPQGFSMIPNQVVLEEGMIITNEPGIYKDGKHGIRTENTMIVVKDETTEYGGDFKKFNIISYCPIDLEGVIVEMMTEEEKAWINNYHKVVYDTLSPYLNEAEKAFLRKETLSL